MKVLNFSLVVPTAKEVITSGVEQAYSYVSKFVSVTSEMTELKKKIPEGHATRCHSSLQGIPLQKDRVTRGYSRG